MCCRGEATSLRQAGQISSSVAMRLALAFDGDGRDEVDRQRSGDRAGADYKQDGVIPAGALEEIRKTIGSGGLEQCEYGGGLRPGGALIGVAVRQQFVDAAKHERNDARCEATDNNA